MNIKLQNQLYSKYPKLFKQKDLDMTKTCMCWGIDTNDGWYPILDRLCDDITTYCNKKNGWTYRWYMLKELPDEFLRWVKYPKWFLNGLKRWLVNVFRWWDPPAPEFVQIKEKWGLLRIYMGGDDDYIRDLINKAEEESGNVCEDCGSTDGVTTKSSSLFGWIRSLCPECRFKNDDPGSLSGTEGSIHN